MQSTELTIIIEENAGFRGWWNRNRKKVLITCGVVAGALGGYALYMNRSSIGVFAGEQLARMASLTDTMPKETICQASSEALMLVESTDVQEISEMVQSINVTEHIRNLSGGRSPSLQKVATALEHNFVLGEHQTWVESYIKNLPCA